jgi:hypothetical protein
MPLNLNQLEQLLMEFFSSIEFIEEAYLFGSTVRIPVEKLS